MPGVLRHHAGGVAGRRQFHLLEPRLDLFGGQFHVQLAFGDVEHDDIAVFDGADWPASDGFRGDMAGHEAVRGAREPTVGQQRD